MDNKAKLKLGAGFISLLIFIMLTIITCAGVWNHCPEAFVKWCAGFLMAANGFVAYYFGKKWYKNFLVD